MSALSLRTAIVGLAVAVSVGAAAADVWTRASAPNGAFSAETPCSAQEVEKLRQAPENLGSVQLPVAGRVMCVNQSAGFTAGEVTADDLPATGPGLFDSIVEQARNDTSAGAKPVATTLNGRRAMVNREASGDTMAQTGFIETGRNKMILIIAGFSPGNGLTAAEQGQQIDHFFHSIEVNGK